MTTKVTIDAHAGWPVKVTQISLDNDGAPTGTEAEYTVPANTVQNFYVHSHMKLMVEELKNT